MQVNIRVLLACMGTLQAALHRWLLDAYHKPRPGHGLGPISKGAKTRWTTALRGDRFWMVGENRRYNDASLWYLGDDPYAPQPAGDTGEAVSARERLTAAARRLHAEPP